MFRWVNLLLAATSACTAAAQPGTLTGRVISGEGPVPFAAVVLEGTVQGTTCEADGRFRMERIPAGDGAIVVSAMGHATVVRSFTMDAGATLDLSDIVITDDREEMPEMVVTGTLREVSRDESPVPVEVITPRLFRRNPSPALFDAVGMVNGVRPQINCSVCNTGDIHINGMEGPYTMVLIDGMPIVSGLSTVYGLSGIPTALVERIEVVKGPGSALYGSEAMGGIINVITRDPVLAPDLSLDLMGTTYAEGSLDLGLRGSRGAHNGLFGVNAFHYDMPVDRNDDGFTDVTLQKRISLFGKWDLQRPDRRIAGVAARYVAEDRWGGQMQWTPADRGGDRVYGENIITRRWELIGQYQLPMAKKVFAQFSYNHHDQDSWYGTVPYMAVQRVFFAQLHALHDMGPRHELLGGIAYRYTWYDDNTPATLTGTQRTPLPGLFVQDEWSITDRHLALLGMRVDHDVTHGLVPSPRVAWKYAPHGRFTVRASLGTGFRVVNLFTEEHAALTGAREVVITEDLLPERSVNGTVNIVKRWPGERRSFGIDGSLFWTRFSNRILPDYHSDPDLIIYSNLHGYGISRGVSLNTEMRWGRSFRTLAGVTWMDVHTSTRDEMGEAVKEEQLFAPDWSGTFTMAFDLPKRWGADLTGQWYGPMLLPVLPNDHRPAHSPTYALLNVQLRRRISDHIEVYGGVKNLLDFVPADPLMRPFDPFDRDVDDPVNNPDGHTFDTAYMYAPLQGARGFIGLRLTLDR